jgi:Fe-S-cluster containining protein
MLGKPMSHSEQLSQTMSCRIGCGACCIAPSISSTLPLHPHGKAAGVRCLHLDAKNTCRLFLSPSRPLICQSFQATLEVCGDTAAEALATLTDWETRTK